MTTLGADGMRRDFYVHVLVAHAFLGPPPTPQHEVAHLNGDRGNPALYNLAWKTRTENAADRAMHGTQRGAPAEGHPRRVLNDEARLFVEVLRGQGASVASLARAFRVDESTVRAVGKARP